MAYAIVQGGRSHFRPPVPLGLFSVLALVILIARLALLVSDVVSEPGWIWVVGDSWPSSWGPPA